MEPAELRRLIVRHRHVAPMLSVLLASTDARVTITDLDGGVILDRQAGAPSSPPADAATDERHPIAVDGTTVGWVSGPRPSGAIAAVLSYACAREGDKRELAREALERYRELNLIFDLADEIGSTLEVDAVARTTVEEASRLPGGGTGFVLLRDPSAPGGLAVRPSDAAGDPPIPGVSADAGIVGAVLSGDPEIVDDLAADGRATESERVLASLAIAPLRVRGRTIGVVGAASRTPRTYTASDLRLLTAIASLAGPTLEGASTHEAGAGSVAAVAPRA